MKGFSVAIIVLNWNNAQDTLACLASLAHSDAANHKILVVDNGSTDNSVPAILQAFPEVRVIETHENQGYAGGNNVGIRYALTGGADYVCILNNDVVVAPDFLTHLLRACESDLSVGVTCPMICEEAHRDTVWALGMAVKRRDGSTERLCAGQSASALAGNPPFEVDAAVGTAMLVRAQLFEQVGLFDESYYLYYEETDWSLRARWAGHKILAVPAAQIWHKVSASLTPSSPVIDYYMLRNHLLFAGRHINGIQRLSVLSRITVRNLVTIAAYTVKPHHGRRRPHRNARLFALRDAALGRWGKMGSDVAAVCLPVHR